MSINEKVVSLLKKKKLKISCAESCTGGLLSSSITSVDGSSKVFSMGLVTYSNQAKNSILNVPKIILKKYGAVSKECCLSMVNNLNKISKSNICISITGVAGPSGGAKNKPIGLVYVGLKRKNKVIVKKFNFKNMGRLYIQKKTVLNVLNLILKTI
jgi:nicotinamide-nucleotide amidase|tara:strand:+ start:419 stop:886 length:468 start_codon:yes stop_codon:yes gene_type:complete